MPELPEVETIVRQFRQRLTARRIETFTSRWARKVLPDVATVRRETAGRRIVDLTRRGKYIVFSLEGTSWLLIHLGMSGRLELTGLDSPKSAHTRAWWDLDDHQRLLFCDARKFGRIIYTDDLRAATRHLGREPLEGRFTVAALRDVLRSRARQLKPLLLDQSVIAGLGNIYTDESLFRAGLHPALRANALTGDQIARLHRAIRGVLRQAIRHNGTSIDWVYGNGRMQRYLRVYGRQGQPCRRCGTAIVRDEMAQRGTHFCPTCQPRHPC